MIFTVPLAPGTVLANVVYEWLISGVPSAASSSGITQPDSNFAVFRISSVPDPNAEEMIVYDTTNLANWNVAGYRAGLNALAGAQQILLVNLWPGGAGPATIVPAAAAHASICRCFGTFYYLGANAADGITVTFTLVQVDATTPSIVYDQSATLIKNAETGQLITERVINATITAGQLTDQYGNPYVDLCRTDYMNDQNGVALPRMKYLMTCSNLGAPQGLNMTTSAGPAPLSPTTFVLDHTDIQADCNYTDGQTTSGSTAFSSATAGFVAGDVGHTITGTNIPAGATIATVINSTSITLSAAATGTGSNLAFTIKARTAAGGTFDVSKLIPN